MKIIFLDHDGVICLSNNWGGRFKKQSDWGGKTPSMGMQDIPLQYRFDNFDVKSIKVLNEILEETGAEIVVSSDWTRWATLEEMGEYYELQGIIKKPIDFTGSITHGKYDEFPWQRQVMLEQVRSLEILEYLENNPNITNWVAIDDLDMSIRTNVDGEYSWGLENFVLTPNEREGIKQSGIGEKIKKFLK